MMNENNNKQILQVKLLCFFFIGCYLAGWLFPDVWWSTHSLAFMPVELAASLLFLCAVVVIFPERFRVPDQLANFHLSSSLSGLIILLIAVCSSVYFYSQPIVIDVMGDAYRFGKFYADPASTFHAGFLAAIFDWNIFHLKNGERTVLNLMHYVAVAYNQPINQGFRYMDALCGGLYVFSVLRFASLYCRTNQTQLVLIVMCLLAPYVWMFFGHMEIYAPAIVLQFIYLACLLLFFEQPSIKRILVLLVLLYCCIRVHSIHFLLVPSMLMVLLWFYLKDSEDVYRIFNWKNASYLLFMPAMLIGLVLYFPVLGDYQDKRGVAETLEQVFVPLLSQAPPYDRYSMFSSAHLFDFFIHIFMVSSAALFVIAGVILFQFKSMPWRDPKILVLSVSLILFLATFFVINPFLGMPLDIDLFSVSGPLLILTALVMLEQVKVAELKNRMIAGVMALSLLTLPILYVQSNEKAMSEKLINVGVRTFNTYWMGASMPVLIGLRAFTASEQVFEQRIAVVVEQIGDSATAGSDIEYANILHQIGEQYRTGFQRHEKAAEYFQRAFDFNRENEKNNLRLLEVCHANGEYLKAYHLSTLLIKARYPDHKQAVLMAIDLSLKAGEKVVAVSHMQEYIGLWPDDALSSQLLQKISEMQAVPAPQ